MPAEKITVAEALSAYTRSNAYGAFMEDRLGTIEAGKLADLVVLSEDILNLDPARIPNVMVDYTIVGGTVRYERKK